jgi:uncharacterized protein (DUF427 family)
VRDYPNPPVRIGHVEPVPRRIRAFIGAVPVLDTVEARYVWEWAAFPQYYIPVEDVAPDVLVDEGVEEVRVPGPARLHGLKVGDEIRPGAAWLQTSGELEGTVRFDWNALDSWFEEDEQVFIHPRSPYSRTDALRSTRSVRVEIEGVVLAESSAPVLVFETGLPTRYYVPRTALHLEHLLPSDTVTACPYKGRTSQYWTARIGDAEHPDIAWSYDFPTSALQPIAGLVAFYNERVDLVVDGRTLDRPVTHFAR